MPRDEAPTGVTVELTEDGYVRLRADVAHELFPTDALVAMLKGNELWLLPLIGQGGGGVLLKQRNRAGDRSALIWEWLPVDAPVGVRQAVWDAGQGALRVDVSRAA